MPQSKSFGSPVTVQNAWAILARRLERRLREETAIVDRIWDLFGRPSYESLKGKSIYDLIQELQQRAEAAEKLRKHDAGRQRAADALFIYSLADKARSSVVADAYEYAGDLLSKNTLAIDHDLEKIGLLHACRRCGRRWNYAHDI